MNVSTLLQTATVLLAIAAVGGLVMAGMRFAGTDRPPSWLAMLHGLLAGSGLTLLLFAGFAAGIPRNAWYGALVLVIAALGGIYINLSYHDKHLPLPKSIIVVHALVAMVGFALVAVSVWRM